MVTTPITASQAVPQANDTAALGRTRLAQNFDTFLSLLTTQLKNQDPLSPLDSNQFTQQLVQMTGVEQQLYTNDLLKSLVSNTSSGVSTAVSLIGKQVRAVSDTAALKDGQARWVYNLDRDAASVKVDVLDTNGSVVQSKIVAKAPAGDNSFTWDGKGVDGSKLPDGTYRLRVTAKDSAGADVAHVTYVDGVATGVEQSNGQTLITIGGAQIPWQQITSIRQADATAPASDIPNPKDPSAAPGA